MGDNGTYFVNILLIAGVIQGFLFNAVSIIKNKAFTDRTLLFLNGIVFFLSLNNLQAWLINHQAFSSYYYAKFMCIPWYFFIIPMFYLFLNDYFKMNKHHDKFLKISTALFVLVVLARFLVLVVLKNQQYSIDGISEIIDYFNLVEETFIIFIGLVILIYTVYCVFGRKERYLDILKYDNLNWLRYFYLFALVLMGLWLFGIYKSYELGSYNPPVYYNPIKIGTSILIYWLGYQGIYQKRFIENRMSLRAMLDDEKRTVARLQENPVVNPPDTKKELQDFNEMKRLIAQHKHFTDPKLSLASLSAELKVSPTYLSQLINRYADTNFTEFINKYRVEQAKLLLSDKKFESYTILSIGLESGFNSKSTFYKAFKKYTSKTPLGYKRQQLRA